MSILFFKIINPQIYLFTCRSLNKFESIAISDWTLGGLIQNFENEVAG